MRVVAICLARLSLLAFCLSAQAQPVMGSYELDRDMAQQHINAVADSLIELLSAQQTEEAQAGIREMEALKAGAKANLDAMVFTARFDPDSTFEMVMSPPSQPAIPLRGVWSYADSTRTATLLVREINQQLLPKPDTVSVPVTGDLLHLVGFLSFDVVLRRVQ